MSTETAPAKATKKAGVGTIVAVIVIAVAASVIGVLYGFGGRSGAELDAQGYVVGDRPAAPVVKGELLEGGTFDLAQQRGTVVVINFWGSWCPPCRAELPELERSYAETKGDRVTFVGVNIRDEREAALQFIAARKPAYPSLYDFPGETALGFEVSPGTIPATIVVDREGRIAAVIRKAVYAEDLTAVVRKIASGS